MAAASPKRFASRAVEMVRLASAQSECARSFVFPARSDFGNRRRGCLVHLRDELGARPLYDKSLIRHGNIRARAGTPRDERRACAILARLIKLSARPAGIPGRYAG